MVNTSRKTSTKRRTRATRKGHAKTTARRRRTAATNVAVIPVAVKAQAGYRARHTSDETAVIPVALKNQTNSPAAQVSSAVIPISVKQNRRKAAAKRHTRPAQTHKPQMTHTEEIVSPVTKAIYAFIELEKNAVDVVFDTVDAVLYFLFGPRSVQEPPEENKLASWTLPDVPKVVGRAVSEAKEARAA